MNRTPGNSLCPHVESSPSSPWSIGRVHGQFGGRSQSFGHRRAMTCRDSIPIPSRCHVFVLCGPQPQASKTVACGLSLHHSGTRFGGDHRVSRKMGIQKIGRKSASPAWRASTVTPAATFSSPSMFFRGRANCQAADCFFPGRNILKFCSDAGRSWTATTGSFVSCRR